MWEDPIVEEIRKVREGLAAKFNYDVTAIVADLMKRQTALGSRLVRRPPKPPPLASSGGRTLRRGR